MLKNIVFDLAGTAKIERTNSLLDCLNKAFMNVELNYKNINNLK